MKVEEAPAPTRESTEPAPPSSRKTIYVKVEDARPDGYDGTCLRPLGLCELGGCCDACWYRPDHPRFQSSKAGSAGANNR